MDSGSDTENEVLGSAELGPQLLLYSNSNMGLHIHKEHTAFTFHVFHQIFPLHHYKFLFSRYHSISPIVVQLLVDICFYFCLSDF